MDIDYGDVFFGALIALIVAEGTAWLPGLSRRIIRLAARRLSGDLRYRLEEEWLRHIEDTPGTLSPFIAACQCLIASLKIIPIRISVGTGPPTGRIRRLWDVIRMSKLVVEDTAEDAGRPVRAFKKLDWWTRLGWIAAIAVGVALAFGSLVSAIEALARLMR